MLLDPVPTDLSIRVCKKLVKPNANYFPPYETGGTLYPRPPLMGVGEHHRRSNLRKSTFSQFLPCRLVTISKAAWLRPTSSSKTSTTVRHQMEQGQPRLVVTTRRRSYRANMPKSRASQMSSTWIQLPTPRLKKWGLLISLVSQLITSLSHRFHHQSCRLLPSILSCTWQSIVWV
ncbi:Branched-chain amino acid aminotransferase/4-amino-4-deoxychorismate lyase [Streptococcus suis 05ZYH33]|nr:Branched-chain amino acid aminotransferase/4-amino-4-deoxychorismate lyase [Streptococcus suis 05ZYH33]